MPPPPHVVGQVRALVCPGALTDDAVDKGRARVLKDLGAEVTEFKPQEPMRMHLMDQACAPKI
eukprot:1192018-Prorocentrum_minimum.AAC.2